MRLASLPAALVAALALPCVPSPAQQPSSTPLTAEAIMARVAANQDRSDSERLHYIYIQHARVASRKGSTVICEEITDTRITPTEQGSQQQLLKLDGRMLRHGKYVTYDHLPSAKELGDSHIAHDKEDLNITIDHDSVTDRDIVEHMRSNLINDKSRDGIASNLFPLTSKNQSGYFFQLLGRQLLNGRDTYHIVFRPRDNSEYTWKGDAYIDTASYQPVLVRTALARNIPFAVRTLLGTSLPGLGFTITYAPQPDGVWFPSALGTEFKLHVLFFYSRQIVIDAQNHDFQKTHVTSRIIGDVTSTAEPQPTDSKADPPKD